MKSSLDRKTLKVPFTLNTPKDWACPTCQSGVLRINRDTFHKYEIHNSRERWLQLFGQHVPFLKWRLAVV